MRLAPHAPPSDEEPPRLFTTSGPSLRCSAAGVLLLPVLFLSFGASGPQEVEPALVIRGATLIDGTGDPPRSGTTIVIRGGKIAALGPDHEIEVPDGSGRYVIPGLWDLHVHLAKAGGDVLPLFTANGVTGVRDMGGDAAYVSEVREAVRAGRRIGPRIVMAGPIVESGTYMERARHRLVVEPVRRFRAGVGSPERAQVVVDSVAALGADFIKIRTTEDLETYHAIANAARRNGLDMVGHAENIPAEDLLRSGQRSVEHLLFPFLTMRKPAEARRLAREFAEAGTAFVPTLVGFAESILASSDDLASMLADTTGNVEPRRAALAGFLIADWQEQLDERIAEEATGDTLPWHQLHQAQLADLRLLHEAGAPILPGTDIAVLNVFPGSSLHDELVLLVDLVGLSPMEAIEAATRGAARLVGMDDEMGTLRPGLAADLVILDADPLDDIAHTRRIVGVVQRGVYHDARELEELRASVRARAGVVRSQPTEDTGIQAAPSGLFELEASVGAQSIPVRLELLSIEGRPWGRLIVSVGQDLVSAVQGRPTPERGWAFAVGGPIRGMELTFGDRVTGTLELAGSPPIPLEGHRSAAVESADELRAHHVLTSLGLPGDQ
ncbi:MAG: amidohydrolase family protein [Gemmatimonadetes bacterium]|nr:amidohydrolase family protein [Gemmatimonadota bacterium]